MNVPKALTFLLFSSTVIIMLSSCNQVFKDDNYSAYFGGEVTNPTNPYVFFCKDGEVIDTIALKKDNTFLIKFDSLPPGLYTFRHEPEYQYVYFDKNDSIMVHINSKDFDESIVFCGKGDEKNNYLMEMYLKNEADREKMFDVFDYDVPKFNANIDSTYKADKKFYTSHKEDIKWSTDFDLYAKAVLDFNHYSKKELYPLYHKLRTGDDVTGKLPKNYYSFRKNIDFNSEKLSGFSPFVIYLSHMLNNLGGIKYHNHYSDVDLSLKTNINKLNITDTLIKNEKLKNVILNKIAFTYLLEDQNMINNKKFLDTYHKYSTDKSSKNEILKIGNAIQLLKTGNVLPEVALMDPSGNTVSSASLIKDKTVLFFWTENASSHFAAAHKKVLEFKSRHPDYQFIAVNLDENQGKWTNILSKFNFNGIKEYRCANFQDLRSKWAITKVHRTIVLNKDGKIKNAFTNLFDVNFEDNLK